MNSFEFSFHTSFLKLNKYINSVCALFCSLACGAHQAVALCTQFPRCFTLPIKLFSTELALMAAAQVISRAPDGLTVTRALFGPPHQGGPNSVCLAKVSLYLFCEPRWAHACVERWLAGNKLKVGQRWRGSRNIQLGDCRFWLYFERCWGLCNWIGRVRALHWVCCTSSRLGRCVWDLGGWWVTGLTRVSCCTLLYMMQRLFLMLSLLLAVWLMVCNEACPTCPTQWWCCSFWIKNNQPK